LSSPSVIAQVGLQAPVYNLYSESDSSNRVNFPKPVLPLRNWKDPSYQYFELKVDGDNLDISQYISPNIFFVDPFKMDTRGSSYYVPRTVRDELNLIMNRPKDSAFVPIMPVAYLALQLASQYLFVRQKIEITPQDVQKAQEGYPILQELWKKNPQTLSELYKRAQLKDKYTMLELKKLIDILDDNKIVKRKLIENSETQYFYAIGESQYNQLFEQLKKEEYDSTDSTHSPSVILNTRKK